MISDFQFLVSPRPILLPKEYVFFFGVRPYLFPAVILFQTFPAGARIRTQGRAGRVCARDSKTESDRGIYSLILFIVHTVAQALPTYVRTTQGACRK